jgi:deoxyribodipyrimidine photo-lyase
MYDPVKQGYDHDPEGTFVRTWVPELAAIKGRLIHEPWRLSPLELQEACVRLGRDYPERIVEHLEAVRRAREIVRQYRKSSEFHVEAKSTLSRHGSRKRRARPPRDTQKTDSQLPLFTTERG